MTKNQQGAKNIVQEKIFSVMDLNNDGKIDEKDILIIKDIIGNYLDINGDGKVNFQDVKSALSVIIFSALLVTSPAPAFAKGGGSGRSSSRSYDQKYADIHYHESEYHPEYKRHFHLLPTKYDRPWDYKACLDLPEEGEILDVLVDNTLGSYVKGKVKNVNESKCRFKLEYKAAKGSKIGPDHLFATPNRNYFLGLAAIALTKINYKDNNSNDDEESKHLSEAVEEFRDATYDSAFTLLNEEFDEKFYKEKEKETQGEEWNEGSIPPSGTYKGTTNERDGVSQNVSMKLIFEPNGNMYGSGIDSIDGMYEISGEWVGGKVRWTEVYEEGQGSFNVIVRGKVALPKQNEEESITPTIQADFVSDRNVRGNFVVVRTKT